jgi:hypothetical protein
LKASGGLENAPSVCGRVSETCTERKEEAREGELESVA